MAKPVITGCSLVDPVHNSEYHGDLWVQGDSWIFYSVGRPRQYEGVPSDPKHLIFNPHDNYFERGNVYVILRSESQLSPEAEAYIKPYCPELL